MNTFGRLFRVQIWGESHQLAVGVVIDGCPAGISVKFEDFIADLERRKSGTKGTTSRKETDIPHIQSGIYNEYTTGAPISIVFENSDVKSQDYTFRNHPRPGHADFAANIKYKGYNDDRGGGHFSGRLTTGLVAAGVIAKKILEQTSIKAQITEAGGSADIKNAVSDAMKQKDSIGAIIECRVNNIPTGWGEPFFDSVEALIAQGVFSIPGIRGIEFGAGFAAAQMWGSEHNDCITAPSGQTDSNNAGGINGGITNGNEIVFRVAVKPCSSISKAQTTWDFKTGQVKALLIKGRHDTCIALRMPVIVEAITAIALADLKLRYNS